jgi:asparagine synthase (glutamine-hydrolysing)
MCGIFGVINFDGQPVDKNKVLSARDVLAHRGPDDSGVYFSSVGEGETYNHAAMQPCIALAHRRLSIIDLSPAAHQPMVSDDGRFVIVFNGEIYNYEALKTEVGSRQSAVGNNFKSNSDTEVILKLFAAEGAECLNKLRGMFAFAIWDDKEKKLFAARDRFGIKPFYYLHNNKEFIFSSELKAIKHYKKGLTLSMQGMDAFLRTGSVPAPLTIYEETRALLPGHWLECQKSNVKCQKYWTFTDIINIHASIQPYSHALPSIRACLLDSIRAHMVSDVEVGAFLSGGIDSTAIVSLIRQAGREKIKTISVTFPGNKLDESKYSSLAAKKYETNHFEYRLQEDELINDFDKIIEAMDQPTIDGINTYFVSKAAASFRLKVVLSGLGGDELFGGYPSFKLIPKYQRIKNFPFAKMFMKAAAPLLKNKLPAKAIEYLKNPNAQNSEYKLIRGLFTDAELQMLGWAHTTIQPYNHTTEMYEGMNVWMNDLVKVSYLESCVYMRNQLLRDSDVFSMAHSLELRVPFVDHLLYGAVLPYLDGGFDRKYPKKMLVDAVGNLPYEVVHRPKQGFTFPFADWIRSGSIKDSINDSLMSNKMKDYFNTKALLNLQKDFEQNRIHWSRVWTFYILNSFLK